MKDLWVDNGCWSWVPLRKTLIAPQFLAWSHLIEIAAHVLNQAAVCLFVHDVPAVPVLGHFMTMQHFSLIVCLGATQIYEQGGYNL